MSAVGQPSHVGADDQRLERSGADDRSGVRDDRTHKPLQAAAHLGHGDDELALGGLDPARAVAVARAGRVGCSRVAGAPEECRELVLDRTLEDEPGAEPAQFSEPLGVIEPIEQGRLDRFLDPGTGGYSSFHGVVSFANFLGPLGSLRRLHFYSSLRTPPFPPLGGTLL